MAKANQLTFKELLICFIVIIVSNYLCKVFLTDMFSSSNYILVNGAIVVSALLCVDKLFFKDSHVDKDKDGS